MSDLSDVLTRFQSLTLEIGDDWEADFRALLTECGKPAVMWAVADECKSEHWTMDNIRRKARNYQQYKPPQQHRPNIERDYVGFIAPTGYIPKLVSLMKRRREMDTEQYVSALAALASEYGILDELTIRRLDEISAMAQRRREKGYQRGNLF